MASLADVVGVVGVMAHPVALVSGDGERVVFANAELERLCGYAEGGLADHRLGDILPNGVLGVSCVHRGGYVFPVVVKCSTVIADGLEYLLCVVNDEREHLQARADLYREARTDPLTGLANRLVLEERMVHAAGPSGGAGVSVLLAVDVDHFKSINDTYGHPVGDAVLIELARRLRRNVRPGDAVVRLGGDEFAVVCDRTTDAPEAIAGRLLDTMTEPVRVQNIDLHIGFTVGVAVAPLGSVDASAMLAAADESLYEGKRAGRGRRGPVRRLPVVRGTADVDVRSAKSGAPVPSRSNTTP